MYCAVVDSDSLFKLHCTLCHPGITRLVAFIRSRNLAFPGEDVRRVTNSCETCNECKPRFYKPNTTPLIKATQAYECLNIDFKGPLLSSSHNKYILTIIDEYSRFPFAFACADVSTETVIKCLTQLFALFSLLAYIHSDRGSSFLGI